MQIIFDKLLRFILHYKFSVHSLKLQDLAAKFLAPSQ